MKKIYFIIIIMFLKTSVKSLAPTIEFQNIKKSSKRKYSQAFLKNSSKTTYHEKLPDKEKEDRSRQKIKESKYHFMTTVGNEKITINQEISYWKKNDKKNVYQIKKYKFLEKIYDTFQESLRILNPRDPDKDIEDINQSLVEIQYKFNFIKTLYETFFDKDLWNYLLKNKYNGDFSCENILDRIDSRYNLLVFIELHINILRNKYNFSKFFIFDPKDMTSTRRSLIDLDRELALFNDSQKTSNKENKPISLKSAEGKQIMVEKDRALLICVLQFIDDLILYDRVREGEFFNSMSDKVIALEKAYQNLEKTRRDFVDNQFQFLLESGEELNAIYFKILFIPQYQKQWHGVINISHEMPSNILKKFQNIDSNKNSSLASLAKEDEIILKILINIKEKIPNLRDKQMKKKKNESIYLDREPFNNLYELNQNIEELKKNIKDLLLYKIFNFRYYASNLSMIYLSYLKSKYKDIQKTVGSRNINLRDLDPLENHCQINFVQTEDLNLFNKLVEYENDLVLIKEHLTIHSIDWNQTTRLIEVFQKISSLEKEVKNRIVKNVDFLLKQIDFLDKEGIQKFHSQNALGQKFSQKDNECLKKIIDFKNIENPIKNNADMDLTTIDSLEKINLFFRSFSSLCSMEITINDFLSRSA